jgi:hypothetical protein
MYVFKRKNTKRQTVMDGVSHRDVIIRDPGMKDREPRAEERVLNRVTFGGKNWVGERKWLVDRTEPTKNRRRCFGGCFLLFFTFFCSFVSDGVSVRSLAGAGMMLARYWENKDDVGGRPADSPRGKRKKAAHAMT